MASLSLLFGISGRVLTSSTQLALSSRTIVTTSSSNSVFMKRQKKMDPEVAKQRETRRRKRLEKEIRQMQKHSKKPKPVDELTLDIKSAKNLHERHREQVPLSEEQIDERAIAMKEYTRSRNALQKIDDAWIRRAIADQSRALRELKLASPTLYEQAIQPSNDLPLVLHGPALTPPIPEYQSPDGDYIDTTRTWS